MKQSQELTFALDICKQAGEIALAHQRRGISSQMKYDGTPVTAADQECERYIRQAIVNLFPSDSILGEEEGASAGAQHERRWIIDPIDGTYNYARGLPIYSTLLALETNGEVVLGVIHAPAFSDTYWAERGGGAFKNGERLHVSKIARLEESLFGFGGPNRILDAGYWDSLTQLVSLSYRQRAFGDYLGFAYVFEGKAECMLEVGLQPWDLAPMKIIAQEAGGRFSDLAGSSSIYTGDCLVTNGLVHEPILKVITDNRRQVGHK